MDPDKSLIQVILIRSLHKGQTDDQGADWYKHADAHAHLQNQLCTPCKDDCLDMHFMLIMHRVDAGRAVLENTVCPQLSLTTLPMPIPAIQDIINQGTCHAALVSGELQIGGLRGIALQVITAHTGALSCRSQDRYCCSYCVLP